MRTRQSKTDEYQTPPELIATLMLRTFEQVPSSRRASALQATVEHYRRMHAGLPLPEWVQLLADMADREAPS